MSDLFDFLSHCVFVYVFSVLFSVHLAEQAHNGLYNISTFCPTAFTPQIKQDVERQAAEERRHMQLMKKKELSMKETAAAVKVILNEVRVSNVVSVCAFVMEIK